MAELKLHTVKPPFPDVDCRLGEVPDDFLDVLDLHLLRNLSVNGVRNRRWSPDGQPRERAAALLPVVIDLSEYLRLVLMYGPGNLSIAGHDLGPECLYELLVSPVGRMDRLFFRYDKPGAASRPRPVVVGMPLGREAVFGKTRKMGGKGYPVRYDDLSDLQWGKKILELSLHCVLDNIVNPAWLIPPA